MKKVIVFLFVFVCAINLKAQTGAQPCNAADNPNAPVMTFEKDVVDYGTIEYGADGNREFKFKNTGKEPLIIYSATGSCGCTVPTHPKEPIKPGETAVIKVHYDTKRAGGFEKSISVESNAKNCRITLKIKGHVKSPAPTGTAPSKQ